MIARRLAKAGATAHQIAEIAGHKTLSEVTRYTEAADQKRWRVTPWAGSQDDLGGRSGARGLSTGSASGTNNGGSGSMT